MEKSARTINRGKFRRLSPRGQHALLAELAREARDGGEFEWFFNRYRELQSWAALDAYAPPPWLTETEALEEFIAFHSRLSFPPGTAPSGSGPVSWQPRFQVEVVLDQVRSPYNVGSVLRILDNFGFKGLVHATAWLRLDHPQLRKAARGCEQWIPVRYEPALPTFLQRADVPVIGIENDPRAIAIDRWAPADACLLVVGNESGGISAAVRTCCSQMVRVPLFGFKQSMNLHHALAVVAHRIVDGRTG